ncbi:uncharacterized protein LOC142340118 isoform X1 [Convolutriloba macropyga]|uniref:uncharacterized protein LOC142340118 isoform X1 n=1 Tax=Convolutriloba macropyga TaxID=536237 RepID=UPI003F527869
MMKSSFLFRFILLVSINFALGLIHVTPQEMIVVEGETAIFTCCCNHTSKIKMHLYFNGDLVEKYSEKPRGSDTKNVSVEKSFTVENVSPALNNSVFTCSCRYKVNSEVIIETKNATVFVLPSAQVSAISLTLSGTPVTTVASSGPASYSPDEWQVIAKIGNSFKKSQLTVTKQGHVVNIQAEKTTVKGGKKAANGVGKRTLFREWKFVAPDTVDSQSISAEYDKDTNQVIITGQHDDIHSIELN